MPVIVKSNPQILHAIVGTAGHVDHGKTSLVRLLTGCETDRLPEEKARGMSIDLGFAPCLLHGRRLVGIVDVPGHKDFIRNMVAGAASIDVLLLVVAADDGVMPQTDEHMKIVKLLRTPQVMVALTKIDMVSPDMLELAKADVAAFLARVGYPDAPIIPVSNKTGDGISEIRDTIDALVEQVRQRPIDDRAFRMNVERVFSVKGYGTVVTGIPVSGRIGIGGRLDLLPKGPELTVRTIQSYKLESETAAANCCCAINVRDVEPSLVLRGMAIGEAGVYQVAHELIVLLQNVSEATMLKRRFETRLHTGTAAIECSIKLLESDSLAPGEESFAHVVLEEPVAMAAGDRFIIRQPSPGITLGGGIVLTVQAQRIRRHEEVVPRLKLSAESAQAGDYLLAELLACPEPIASQADAIRLTQRSGDAARRVIADAVSAKKLADLDGAYLVQARLGELVATLTPILTRYHQQNPYSWGMTPNHVCEALGLEAKSFPRLSPLLVGNGFVVKHGRLALTSFKPAVSERLMGLRDQILKQIQEAGVHGPARGDLMKTLQIVEADMKILGKLLVEDGTVVVLDGNFVLRSVFDEARKTLLRLFESAELVDLSAFRDAIGGTRKVAVAMLDAFDVEGMTRRVPDGRMLVKRAAKAALDGTKP
jgi:selenocysteine-specific elongation factor